MRIGLLILDSRGGIASFNAAAEHILGYRALEVRGRPGDEIIDGLSDLLAENPGTHTEFQRGLGRTGGQAVFDVAGRKSGACPRISPDDGQEMQPGEMPLTRNARHKDGRIIPLVVTPYLLPGNLKSGDTHRVGRTARYNRDAPEPSGLASLEQSERGASASDAVLTNGVVIVFQDAQQLEKMGNQLQHLDRLHSLDQFAAGIVHEIRNPLAGISINAQFIMEDIGKHCRRFCKRNGRSPRFHEEMQDILADVQSIEGIVKKVLDFAHPNKSQVQACAIEDIVREVLRFSEVPLRRQGIRLVTDVKPHDGTPARVRVDVSQVKQVLFNIIRNACDAMPGGGELRVSTTAILETAPLVLWDRDARRPSAVTSPALEAAPLSHRGRCATRLAGRDRRVLESRGCNDRSDRERCTTGEAGGDRRVFESRGSNGHVRVEVEDTGRGIAEKYLGRIFDPFFSMRPEGTGLGLAIARKIIENHGGRIEVKSRPGKGTSFGIVLPTV